MGPRGCILGGSGCSPWAPLGSFLLGNWDPLLSEPLSEMNDGMLGSGPSMLFHMDMGNSGFVTKPPVWS